MSQTESLSTGPYANLRDVRGLLGRMLASRNGSAYRTLLREGLAKLAIPFDLLMSPLERRRIRAAEPSDLPVILIVGMPRAGTTLVCQVLSRYLDVAHVNNLSALFPRSTITAAQWFSWMLRDGRPSFTSYYGNTPRLSDPNEGFHIWNRWLGADHYRAADSLDPQALEEMAQFLDAWRSAFGKPFLNKSVRNTDAATRLGEAIPGSYFIAVRREPTMVARSLISARQHIQGGKEHRWGLYSREDAVHADPLGYVDDVCRQVQRLTLQLDRAKRELGPERFLEIDYETFCRDPQQAVFATSLHIPQLKVREQKLARELRPFQISNGSRLTPEEEERMQQCLDAVSNRSRLAGPQKSESLR